MKLETEDLRSDLFDLVKKYAKNYYELNLSEDEAIEIADDVLVNFGIPFYDVVSRNRNVKLIAENKKLKELLKSFRVKRK